MIRKWTMTLLSLLLALMLPFAAFAQTQHALTVELGDMLATEPVVNDLLDVLTIKVTPGEKSGALTLTLDDTDIVTLGAGLDVSGLYVYSGEVLGEDVLCVNWDDAFTFLKGMIAAEMAAEETAGLGEMLEMLDQFKAQFLLALENGVQVNTNVTMSKEEAMAQVSAMLGDDYPEMMAWIGSVYEKLTVQDGQFTAENRDAADQKYTLSLTNDDFLALMQTDYSRATLEKQILAQDATLEGDALKQMTEEQLKEVCAAFEVMDIVVVNDVYTLDEGKTVVGMALNMDMVSKEEAADAVKMTVDYNRCTTEAGISYKANMLMDAAGEKMAEMKLDSLCGADGTCKGIAGMLVDGEEIVLQFGSEKQADHTAERFASLYLRSDATAILEPGAADRPIITFHVNSSDVDCAAVTKLDAASLENSVDVMKMTSEEMEALVTDVSSRGMQVMFTAMSKLPTSVLNLIMGEM